MKTQMKSSIDYGLCNRVFLNITSEFLAGDSEARKTLMALLLFLTGDFSAGVLQKNVDALTRNKCKGELQFLNPDCKEVTFDSSIFLDDEELCGFGGSFLAEYFPDFNTFLTSSTSKRIETLKDIENTYILFNSGAHFNANPQSFIQYYLRFIVEKLRDLKWPKVIVETLPRTPSVVLSDQRGAFRQAVAQYCHENGIFLLDNFEIASNLLPYDGKHFRLPFYLQKIEVLLNFLRLQMETC